MSKNHPHDNIYSILGKLDALKPTPAEKHQSLLKEIRKSVEAQGSVLTGVNSVEDKLTKQFNESKIEEKAVSKSQQKFMGMVHAAQKGEKAASPEVAKVAKSMGKKDAKDFASTKHKDLPAHVEETGEVCSECGMLEDKCGCDHTNEGEITKTDKGMRHRGTYGTEYQGDHDAEDEEQYKADKGIRKRGRPAKGTPKKAAPATSEKKGRGRPAKAAAPTYSTANDPFGRVPSKAPASKVKGVKHSLDESMRRIVEGVNFRRMAEDNNLTLDEMMDCMERDIAEYKSTGKMTEALRDFMEIHTHSKKQMADEAVNVAVPAALRKQQGGDWMAKPSDVLDPKPDTLSHPANMQKRADALGFNDANPFAMPKKDINQELDELAQLAGLNMESVDKDKFAALAEPKDKITYADKIAGATKDEVDKEVADEGNAFGGAVAKAKADGIQRGEKVKVGGKEYPVKEAQELVAMLRVAGIDTKQLEEAIDAACQSTEEGIEEGVMSQVDALYNDWVNSEYAPMDDESGDYQALAQKAEAFLSGQVDPAHMEDYVNLLVNNWHGGLGEEYANEPDEEYLSMKASTLNPGEGDFGEKNMYGGPGDNKMTQAPDRPARPVKQVRETDLQLEAKLAAEYESIKKIASEGVLGKIGGAIKGAFSKKTDPNNPSGIPNLFDLPHVKADTKAYLKKSAKQPGGPNTVKNIFHDPKYNNGK